MFCAAFDFQLLGFAEGGLIVLVDGIGFDFVEVKFFEEHFYEFAGYFVCDGPAHHFRCGFDS